MTLIEARTAKPMVMPLTRAHAWPACVAASVIADQFGRVANPYSGPFRPEEHPI